MPFCLAFPAAGLGAALFALVSGYFCVRLIKLYFAMLTLAFSQIVWAIAYKWNDVTGGDQGLPEMPFPDLDWMSALPGFGRFPDRRPVLSADAGAGRGVAGGHCAASSARRSAAC